MADPPSERRSRTMLPTLEDAVQCPLLDGRHEEWIRCCTARFLPLARRVAGDDPAAQDALQESWIAVLRGIGGYRGRSPACAWVREIVRHEALHEATRRRRDVPLTAEHDPDVPARRRMPPVPDGANPEADEHRRQLVRILLEAVNRLPEAYREVVLLRDIEDLPPATVAASLHISQSNVSSRLNRAHGLLRRRLLQRLGADASVGFHPSRHRLQKKCDRSGRRALYTDMRLAERNGRRSGSPKRRPPGSGTDSRTAQRGTRRR